ncbi:sarcosine oxidase subunit delta [Roseibium aggregatum]|uniref:Sarcosine oxidase subunit delta n=1 Tax=Roseibium aggregatum TaxID=187304 RepID=A0A939EDX8_9HYPH|nr:sarcosine oxidase subunit delta [Roseibium aggregatum]MBN9670343.1 sarcosine oxidase subunit delta [Roseibium aggregatum]
MLLIYCPYCQVKRAETEFHCGGEAHIARPSDPSKTTDEDWVDFLYTRSNIKGVYAERWRHIHGCGRFFNAVRDTVSDDFLKFYKAGEPMPDLNALAAEAGK